MSSGSDSESDESQKSNGENELFNVHKNNGRNDGAAESCNSSAAEEEDDSNPFGVSGSDDEGTVFCYNRVNGLSLRETAKHILRWSVLGGVPKRIAAGNCDREKQNCIGIGNERCFNSYFTPQLLFFTSYACFSFPGSHRLHNEHLPLN